MKWDRDDGGVDLHGSQVELENSGGVAAAAACSAFLACLLI